MERTRMKRQFSVRWSLLAGALACAGVAAMPGCELIVDFDRTKIPLGDGSADDATIPDGSVEEEGGDAAPDTSTREEAGVDAGPDSPGTDAAPDVGMDSTVPDAEDTGTPDTGIPETSTPDSPTDVEQPDVAPEAAPDDSGPDASDGS